MKLSRLSRLSLAFVSTFAFADLHAAEPDPGQIEISVARLLEQGHYSRKRLDEKVGRTLLKNYLEALDYNRVYFTQKDVDGLVAKYGSTLDNDILLGNPDPAAKIFKLYKQRVEERIAKAKELLKQKYDFTSDKMIEVNRQKSAWPKDDAEADALWRDRVEGELLQEKLSKHEKDPVTRITKRYDQMLRNLREQTNEDIMKGFLTTLALTYDPHSEYMSKSELENFSINMRLSLVGIGAVLHSEDGYAKIAELVPGGPASKDGRLKVGDRVTAVAQGDKEFVDAVDMKLDKVVEMIRGKKDTIVRMQVIPVSATDPSVRKVIDIKRDEIKLKEQEAKAEIIERPGPDGTTQRLGWIVLPSFYADMEHSGAANAKSTTKDVLALINRLKAEGVTGIVMDLRRNGGGSLEEAVNLTGLFIKKGPVVQAKDSNGAIHVSKDRDTSVAWDGPLVVLTNRLSASASEIFAAALQDYNRAVVVGDQNTFGKGTVQTMLEIGRVMTFLGSGNQAGALKLTIQKFYRVAGGSTQLKGVESDIKLPSPYDHPEIGESSLKAPLPYDTVEAVPFDKLDKPLFKSELKTRSAARVLADPEFRYITEDLDRVKQRLAENKISLNEKQRQRERDEMKARNEARTAERAKLKAPEQKVFAVTLENVNKPELVLATKEKNGANLSAFGDAPMTSAEPLDAPEKKTEKAETPADGVPKSGSPEDEEDEEEVSGAERAALAIKAETLSVLADLIELQRGGKGTTASATVTK
jgi:carboxyl-terminal processing protease